MTYLLIMIGIIFCAIQAFRVQRLLTSALWLAGVSALVASLLYALGAYEIAVIELSVGAGLVTVLFVFAISLAGDESGERHSQVPTLLAWTLTLAIAGLSVTQIWPSNRPADTQVLLTTFSPVLWHERSLDVLLQIGLIFAGALGILNLLSEAASRENQASAKGSASLHPAESLPPPQDHPPIAQPRVKEPSS